jgi:hypothetical protein
MPDPIADIIGDYRAFATTQRDRLIARGIDIAPYALSHLAVRVPDWDLYVHQRTLLERYATANFEDVWNGRPISKIVLAEPLVVLDGSRCRSSSSSRRSTSASTGWASNIWGSSSVRRSTPSPASIERP